MSVSLLSFRSGLVLVGGLLLAAVVTVALLPPLPQPLAYHAFSDGRALFGVPNFWNVASNLPFLCVGLVGMRQVLMDRPAGGLPELRDAYLAFFLGAALVALGSAYYHWAPGNDSLVYDRLPMAICFMAFVAIVIGEHVSPLWGRRTLAPLLVIGVSSVLHWYATEIAGRGDLRPYLVVQFAPMVLVPIVLCTCRSRLSKVGYLWGMLIAYALAKKLESADDAVYAVLGQTLSGHTLKHVSAAFGVGLFLLALRRRQPRIVAAMSGLPRNIRYGSRASGTS